VNISYYGDLKILRDYIKYETIDLVLDPPLEATMSQIRFSTILFAVFISFIVIVQTASGQQKVIKDPGEYNAYIAALNTTDPTQKAAAMETFVNQYPNSIVKVDAMEQTMGAYQHAGNSAKVEQTADRILQFDPDDLHALAISIILKRVQAKDEKDAAAIGVLAERGLKVLPNSPKPDGASDADFKKLSDELADIFNGGAGYALLQAKDYAHARPFYLKAIQIDPTNLQDIYQLSIADLEMAPLDIDGLWYIAKAINMAQAAGNQQGAQSMRAYGKAKYHRYHGSDDGWDGIMTSAANQSSPPSGFAASIRPAPTPAELAVQAVAENDPATLSFSDYEFVLSYRDASPGNKLAAERVWQAIQAKQKNGVAKLQIAVKVISSTKTTIQAAITEDDQASNTADVEITMETPLALPPAPGSQINIIGVLTDYTPRPFMFRMKHGALH